MPYSDLGFEEEDDQKHSDLGFVAEPSQAKKPSSTYLESGLRGAAQGATMGFADELEGGLRGAGDVIFGSNKFSELPERYRERRDTARAQYEKAREDNPKSYMAGEVGGGVGTAFLPGIGLSNVASKAGLLGKIAEGAVIGGTQGLGTSTADLTKGDIEGVTDDVKKGAAIGGIASAIINPAISLAKTLTPTNVARKLSNVFLNTPEEVTETYINNPQGVLNAPRRHELASEYEGLLDKLKGEVQGGSQASRKILEDEGLRFKGNEIANLLNKRADEIASRSEGVWDNPEQLAAYNWLKETAKHYQPEGQALDLSANRIKDTLQGIDRSTQFETAPGKFSNIDDLVKKGTRSDIDTLLKSRSPAYQEQMKQVAADTALLNEASDVARSPQGLANVFRRVETDQYGGGQVPKDVLDRLGQRTGVDILEKAKLSNAREAFDKSVTNGSRNVNFFSNLLKDIPIAKYAAPVLGGTVDKYGRKLTMGAVDTARSLNDIYSREGVQKFVSEIQPIIEAAKQGNPSAILTFQLLSQSNPEALKHLDQGEPGQ